jgi:hypothetical protein
LQALAPGLDRAQIKTRTLAARRRLPAASPSSNEAGNVLPLAVLTRIPDSAMAPFLPPEIAGPGAQVWQDLQAELFRVS